MLVSQYDDSEFVDLKIYMRHVLRLFLYISEIKEALMDDDMEGAAGIWYDLEQSDQDILWARSTTRGGIWTTEERRLIKLFPQYYRVTV